MAQPPPSPPLGPYRAAAPEPPAEPPLRAPRPVVAKVAPERSFGGVDVALGMVVVAGGMLFVILNADSDYGLVRVATGLAVVAALVVVIGLVAWGGVEAVKGLVQMWRRPSQRQDLVFWSSVGVALLVLFGWLR